MQDLALTSRRFDPYLRTGVYALAVLALTSVHHVYGAIVFETPWRLHLLHAAVPAGMAIAAALYVGSVNRGGTLGKLATWFAGIAIFAFPVAVIGLFEGAYNHVLKNVVYFVGGEAAAVGLFPPPTYEMPTDFVFELTGAAQFPLSVLAAIYTLSLLRKVR